MPLSDYEKEIREAISILQIRLHDWQRKAGLRTKTNNKKIIVKKERIKYGRQYCFYEVFFRRGN